MLVSVAADADWTVTALRVRPDNATQAAAAMVRRRRFEGMAGSLLGGWRWGRGVPIRCTGAELTDRDRLD
ncbi:hypothetical protein GCM10010442_76620 [Kitasatospora kifunensis]